MEELLIKVGSEGKVSEVRREVGNGNVEVSTEGEVHEGRRVAWWSYSFVVLGVEL